MLFSRVLLLRVWSTKKQIRHCLLPLSQDTRWGSTHKGGPQMQSCQEESQMCTCPNQTLRHCPHVHILFQSVSSCRKLPGVSWQWGLGNRTQREHSDRNGRRSESAAGFPHSAWPVHSSSRYSCLVQALKAIMCLLCAQHGRK